MNKLTLTILISIVCVNVGWARDGWITGEMLTEEEAKIKMAQESKERSRRSEPYFVEIGTQQVKIKSIIYQKEWTVLKGSETYTLGEFISSGKFCQIYGHQLNLYGEPGRRLFKCWFCRKTSKYP